MIIPSRLRIIGWVAGLLLLTACGRPEQRNDLAPLDVTSGSAHQTGTTATATVADTEPTLKPEYQTNIALGIDSELWEGWTPGPMSAENAAIEAERAALNERARVEEQTAQAFPTAIISTHPADYSDPTAIRPSVPQGLDRKHCNVELPEKGMLARNCWGWILHGEEIVIIAGQRSYRSSNATDTPYYENLGGVGIQRFIYNEGDGAYDLKGDMYWTAEVTGYLEIVGVTGTQVALRGYDDRRYTFDLETHTFTLVGTAPGITPTP